MQRLFTALLAAAALCGAASAIPYEDVMGPLLHMERAPHDPTQFRFDISPWTNLVANPKKKPVVRRPANAQLQDFLRKMHELRHLKSPAAKALAKKRKKQAKTAKGLGAVQPEVTPRKMVVVGAGPNGLVAALLGRYHGYEVEVLEMTDGRDDRWNMVMVHGDELQAFLRDVVGIPSRTYYSVAEMQYVLAAAAQLAGATIRFSHQYVRHCGDAGTVLFRPTPATVNAQRQQPDATVCGAPGALQVIQGVDMLVGSDGTHSFVRAAMKGNMLTRARTPGNNLPTMRNRRVSNSLSAVTTFHTPYERHQADLMGNGPGLRDQARSGQFTLMPAATDTAAHPLLAMLIFEFRAPAAGEPAPNGLTAAFLSKALNQAAPWTQQATYDAMFAANGQVDRDHAMSKLIFQNRANRVVRRVATPANPQTHELQPYTYIDVVFRHRASQSFWTAFEPLTHDGKLAEVSKHARGEANTLTGPERQLADRLIRVMYETGAGYGMTQVQFQRQVGAIKIFGQQLRHAKHVHMQDKKTEVLLVGDSSRDSYFPHGQSFSTAANAFVRFMQARAEKKSNSLMAAARFLKEEVDDFVDVTASSIYFEGFCGIAQMQTRGAAWLSWTSIQALTLPNEKFTAHLAAPPAAGVAAAANGQYQVGRIRFGFPDTNGNADTSVWDRDQRYGSFATGWDTFVQHVLQPRCETW